MPDDIDSLMKQGTVLVRQGDYDAAIVRFQQVLRVRPNFATAHYNIGLAHHHQNKLEEAIGHYQQALRLQPDLLVAANNLGAALKSLGKHDDAIACFREILRLKPDYADVHANLGNALAAQDKLEEAVGSYRQALSLRPDLAQTHYNLGFLLSKLAQVDQAAVHLREALRLKPDHVDAKYHLGILLHEQGKLDEAVTSYQQALQMRPGFADAHYSLGVILGQLQKNEEAIDNLRQALRFKPDYAEAHCCLGTLLRRVGKLNEALAHGQKALALQPRLAVAHYDMGLTLAACGKLEEAKEQFRLALELGPHYAEVWGLKSQILSEQGKSDALRRIGESKRSAKSYTEVSGYFEFTAVYDLAVKECPQGIFVEVGAFMGRSTAYLASEIRDLPVKLYVVDTWRGSGGADYRGDEQYTPMLVMNDGDLFDAFLDNMERCGVIQTIIPLRMRSVQAAKLFCDESVAFCYLDAAHDYDSVKADLTAWFPKVKSGGIIAGDDYGTGWPGVDRAVHEFFADSGKITTIAQSWVFRKP